MVEQSDRLPQIMVVDDDADTVSILARHLQREGFVAIEAVSGAECIRLARENPVDVILLDLMMPEMDGFQVVAALQANSAWRNIPVVVVTALDISAEDRQRLNRGVEHIVSKNASSPAQLLARIGALMGEIKSKAKKDA